MLWPGAVAWPGEKPWWRQRRHAFGSMKPSPRTNTPAYLIVCWRTGSAGCSHAASTFTLYAHNVLAPCSPDPAAYVSVAICGATLGSKDSVSSPSSGAPAGACTSASDAGIGAVCRLCCGRGSAHQNGGQWAAAHRGGGRSRRRAARQNAWAGGGERRPTVPLCLSC
jgi:hypothetical protein